MKSEKKTELKVIYICLALIAAPLLGIDLQAILAIFQAPEIQGAADQVQAGMDELNNFSRSSETRTLSGYVALLGGVYAAGRSAVKSVKSYTGGKDARTTDIKQD